MRVIACQFDIAWEDPTANCQQLRDLLRSQPPEPGDLLVLPEMFATGFSMNADRIAEPTGGPIEQFLRSLALEHRCWTIGGIATRDGDGPARNVAVTLNPHGTVVSRYTKMHPFSAVSEQMHYPAGDELVLFDWNSARVAPLICYDLRFPELFRTAVRRGAQLLLVIASFPASREHHWRTLLTARAIENQAFVVGVNRTGTDPSATYAGASLIIDPAGHVLADAGHQPGCATATLDFAAQREYRTRFPALRDLRPDLNITL